MQGLHAQSGEQCGKSQSRSAGHTGGAHRGAEEPRAHGGRGRADQHEKLHAVQKNEIMEARQVEGEFCQRVQVAHRCGKALGCKAQKAVLELKEGEGGHSTSAAADRTLRRMRATRPFGMTRSLRRSPGRGTGSPRWMRPPAPGVPPDRRRTWGPRSGPLPG